MSTLGMDARRISPVRDLSTLIDPADLRLLVMFHVEDMTQDEIAAELGVTRQTVARRIAASEAAARAAAAKCEQVVASLN